MFLHRRRHEIVEGGGVSLLRFYSAVPVLDTIISDSHNNGCDLFIGRNFLVKKVGFAALVEITENLRSDFAASVSVGGSHCSTEATSDLSRRVDGCTFRGRNHCLRNRAGAAVGSVQNV